MENKAHVFIFRGVISIFMADGEVQQFTAWYCHILSVKTFPFYPQRSMCRRIIIILFSDLFSTLFLYISFSFHWLPRCCIADVFAQVAEK